MTKTFINPHKEEYQETESHISKPRYGTKD